MIDIGKLNYSVTVVDEKGKKYNIKDYITDLGWEENKNELASRISFTVRDGKTSIGYLSKVIKPGCVIIVYASSGEKKKEVARGNVNTWGFRKQNSGGNLRIVAYDILYALQQSQDNYRLESGTGTKKAITDILGRWGVKLSSYKGPDVSHGTKNYKTKYLSDILRSILNDAAKKSGEKCIMRATKGKMEVIKKGSNDPIYYFDNTNSKMVSKDISIADMVTRVRIYGKEEKDKAAPVVAIKDGKTQFGIRQKIYQMTGDETVADAERSAEEILDDEGKTDKDIEVIAVDVPYVRKGDKIYMNSGATNGFYIVKEIHHDAEVGHMTMGIAKIQKTAKENQKGTDKKKSYSVGDVVNYRGGMHYVSSYAGAKGYNAKAGPAKITKGPDSTGNDTAHPWHLIHTDASSNVYGWVDEGTFE